MKTKEAKIKSMKKVIVVTAAMLTASTIALVGALGLESTNSKNNHTTIVSANARTANKQAPDCYQKLENLRKVKLDTVSIRYGAVQYQVASERDILNLSREFSVAIEDYFESCGATHWTNDDNQQFWPEDIEYMVTAIAFRESSYRTDITNELGCKGLTCLKEEELLKTLNDEWLTSKVWGNNVPKVNCNPSEVDMLNGTTCIEYTYYNIGYNLANRFKKDKHFTDIDGARRCVWSVLEYSEDTQNRLLIASHLFGIDNITNSVFKRANNKGKIVAIEDYLYCDYVEDVINKMYELKNTYEYNLGH